MMRFSLTLMSAVLLISTAQAAPPAPANVDEAKKHFARSKELYDDGDLAGALHELERSYQAVPNYKLLYNMGQTQLQMQNHAGALKSFRRFLSEGGTEVSDARRSEVLKEVDKLRTRVAELTVTVNLPGAEVSVDDVVIGTSPLTAPVLVNVGRRKVSASLADHFPVSKQLEVAGLDTVQVALELRAVAVAAPVVTPVVAAPAAATEAPFRLPVWVPWAGTGALAAATTVTGILAYRASAQQTRLLGRYGVTTTELNAAVSTTHTRALVTDVLGGATIAAAVGSLLYTVLRAPEAPAPTPAALQLSVGPSSIAVTGSF
jgi:hypothetical protein